MKTKQKTFTEFTPIGKTYWNDEGIYQKEYTEHYDWYVIIINQAMLQRFMANY